MLLDKYKETKTSITMAVTEALGKMQRYCVTLEDIAENYIAALEHKVPKARVDTAKMLQVCSFGAYSIGFLL